MVGFLLMGFGFSLILRPISVVLDVLPFLGNIAGAGLGLVAGIISLFHLPGGDRHRLALLPAVLGVILLVVAVGLIVGFKMLRSRKAPARPEPRPLRGHGRGHSASAANPAHSAAASAPELSAALKLKRKNHRPRQTRRGRFHCMSEWRPVNLPARTDHLWLKPRARARQARRHAAWSESSSRAGPRARAGTRARRA